MELKLERYGEEVDLFDSYKDLIGLAVYPLKGCESVDLTPAEARLIAAELIRLADKLEEGN